VSVDPQGICSHLGFIGRALIYRGPNETSRDTTLFDHTTSLPTSVKVSSTGSEAWDRGGATARSHGRDSGLDRGSKFELLIQSELHHQARGHIRKVIPKAPPLTHRLSSHRRSLVPRCRPEATDQPGQPLHHVGSDIRTCACASGDVRVRFEPSMPQK
jgi:hypothetical protein